MMDDAWITITLVIFGAAGLLGSAAFSKWYDKCRYHFFRITVLGVAVVLLLLYPVSINHYLLVLLCAIWGIFVTAFNVVGQAELLRTTTMSTSAVAMSIYSGIYNLGIGSGSYLGGLICTHASIAYIGLGGGAIVLLSFIYCAFFLIPAMRRQQSEAENKFNRRKAYKAYNKLYIKFPHLLYFLFLFIIKRYVRLQRRRFSINMSASTTKTKNQPSRKPVLLDYLKAFTKDKLILQRVSSASPTASSKGRAGRKICTEMQKPEIAAKRFAIMPDENIQAFEAALEKNASILLTVNMHCCCPLFLWATLFPIPTTALKQ